MYSETNDRRSIKEKSAFIFLIFTRSIIGVQYFAEDASVQIFYQFQNL